MSRYELITGENVSLGQIQSEWEIQETEMEMLGIAGRLTSMELKAAQLILEGIPPLEAVGLAGFPCTTAQAGYQTLRSVLERPLVKQYMEVAKRLYTQRAMQAVCFDKVSWMRDMKSLLDKSLGREDVAVVAQFEGRSTSQKLRRDDLATARSALELIGKQMGWMVDKKEITVATKETVRVRDYTNSAKAADVVADVQQDQSLLQQLNAGLAEVLDPDDEQASISRDTVKAVVRVGAIHDPNPEPPKGPRKNAAKPKVKPLKDTDWPEPEDEDVDTEW